MRAKTHPAEAPRGVRYSGVPERGSRGTVVQTSGTLVWIQDGQPMRWVDRPLRFPAHIRRMLSKRGGTVIDDIKWRQLGGKVWWRLPDWPDGHAESEYVTKMGRVLTDADFERLADEAERGYDVSR